jgi:hypothetical protein
MAAGEPALVFAGRQSGFAFEEPAKRAGIMIADAFADGVHIQPLGLEQPFCDVDAQRLQIVQRRLADGLASTPMSRIT